MQREFKTDIGTVKAFINVETTYFEFEDATINGVNYKMLTLTVDTNTGRCTYGLRVLWGSKNPTDKARTKVYNAVYAVAEQIRNDKTLMRAVKIEDNEQEQKRLESDIRKLEEKKIELEAAKEVLIKLASTL